MKKFARIMSIIFMILTFVGAGYVLINHGQVNAGYAVVPMSISLAWSGISIGQNKKDKETGKQ